MNPIDVLLGAYRRQLLKLLLLRPEEAFYVREIERLTGIPAGSVHRELKPLVEAGLLIREPLANLVRYRANRSCPIYRELTAILRLTDGPAYRHEAAPSMRAAEPAAAYARSGGGRRDASRALRRLGVSRRAVGDFCRRHRLRKLSLFGSVTRDDFKPDSSDVDVMVEFEPDTKPSLLTMAGLRDDLSALFGGRRVDVITNAPIINPFRREAILRDLETVYAAR
jgi:predicted nucleotidyltransferase